MSGWREQLLSVVACCLVSGILTELLSDTAAKALIHRICALGILLSLLRPLSSLDRNPVPDFPEQLWDAAETWVAEGQQAAKDAQASCIQRICESYILEKAKMLGVTLTEVSITLGDDLCPGSAQLRGGGEDDLREELREILTGDLGIPEEQQRWIWNQDGSWEIS